MIIEISCSNGNTHNISIEKFNELRSLVAAAYGEDFYNVYMEYMSKVDSFNVVSIIGTMNKLMEVVNDNLEAFDYDLAVVEFLTSNRTYTLEGKCCDSVARAIEKTDLGNEEIVNLPTFYKFFKRAGNRNLTITWKPLSDAIKEAEQMYYNK